mmetsp:Transcript_10784/g.23214  ORF Transcript_10784/g.23214 Transcript_10784/m.23214 type:complete len:245 (+) Transcript_10784:410-1144(+)
MGPLASAPVSLSSTSRPSPAWPPCLKASTQPPGCWTSPPSWRSRGPARTSQTLTWAVTSARVLTSWWRSWPCPRRVLRPCPSHWTMRRACGCSSSCCFSATSASTGATQHTTPPAWCSRLPWVSCSAPSTGTWAPSGAPQWTCTTSWERSSSASPSSASATPRVCCPASRCPDPSSTASEPSRCTLLSRTRSLRLLWRSPMCLCRPSSTPSSHTSSSSLSSTPPSFSGTSSSRCSRSCSSPTME